VILRAFPGVSKPTSAPFEQLPVGERAEHSLLCGNVLPTPTLRAVSLEPSVEPQKIEPWLTPGKLCEKSLPVSVTPAKRVVLGVLSPFRVMDC
jgi:hypothetical protein